MSKDDLERVSERMWWESPEARLVQEYGSAEFWRLAEIVNQKLKTQGYDSLTPQEKKILRVSFHLTMS